MIPHVQTFKSAREKREEIAKAQAELGEVRRSLGEAYRQFDAVTDDASMDVCIFEISALRSKYNCAVRNLKSLYL